MAEISLPGKRKSISGKGPVSHTAPPGVVCGGTGHPWARRRSAAASIISDPSSLPTSSLCRAVSISTRQCVRNAGIVVLLLCRGPIDRALALCSIDAVTIGYTFLIQENQHLVQAW